MGWANVKKTEARFRHHRMESIVRSSHDEKELL